MPTGKEFLINIRLADLFRSIRDDRERRGFERGKERLQRVTKHISRVSDSYLEKRKREREKGRESSLSHFFICSSHD